MPHLGTFAAAMIVVLLAAHPSPAFAADEPSGTAAAAAPAPAPTAATEGEDDWDTASPVNRTPRVSGVLMGSFRSTWYSTNTLPDSTRVENFNTFQLEHTHLKFAGDLTSALSWEIMPCLTHMNDFSIVTANFLYTASPLLQVTFGRFLIPFGQFNVRSLPGSYNTVSRPLLYQSHEDRPIRLDPRLPPSLIFTPRDDVGLQLSGSKWFGPADVLQVSYNLALTNGLRAVSDQMGRFWDDNNTDKQVTGRLGVSYNGTPLTLSAAGSYLANRYEKKLDQRIWAVDGSAAYQYAPGRRITARAEYVDRNREIVPTTELLQGDEGLKGAYVTLEANVTDTVSLFYQFDTLMGRTPTAQLNEAVQDVVVTQNRHVAGASIVLMEYLQLRAEYGLWLSPLGLPVAHRLAVQTVVAF